MPAVLCAVSLGQGHFLLKDGHEDGDEDIVVFPPPHVGSFSPPPSIIKPLSISEHSYASTVAVSSDDDYEEEGDVVELDGEWCPSKVEKTAALWQLSTKERVELEQLGRRLRDIGEYHKNKPADVVRFLRARPGDVDAAEIMFRAMVDWRKENNVDSILDSYHPPKKLVDYFPAAILRGLDKEGDPVFLSRDGVVDGVALLDTFGRDELIRHAIWMREMIGKGSWIQEYEAKQGRPVTRIVVIDDVGGLNPWRYIRNRPFLALYGEILRLDQDFYPESAKKLIILRVPSVFHVIWKVIRGMFDDGVVEKMVFLGSRNFEKKLSEYVDLEILPDCIVGIGKGTAIEGMSSNFKGGPLSGMK